MTINLDEAIENTKEQMEASKWQEKSKEADEKLDALFEEMGMVLRPVKIVQELGPGIVGGEQLTMMWMPKPKKEES